MRKFYLFILTVLFATLSAFAQFTNEPEVVSSFDAGSKVWYKVAFVKADGSLKLLTDMGEFDGSKENVLEVKDEILGNDPSQLWQLVGTQESFELVSKGGYHIYHPGNWPYYYIANTVGHSDWKGSFKLSSPPETKVHNNIECKSFQIVCDQGKGQFLYVDGKKIDAIANPVDFYGNTKPIFVVFKKIGEEPKPIEKVSVTIQCQTYQGSVTIDGVTEAPIISGNDNTWSLEAGKEYTLNVVAKKGWEFSHIYDNRYTNLEITTFTASKENTRVEVHFKEKKYSIELYKKVTGGAIQVKNHWSEEASLGQEIQLEAIPDAGYQLDYIKVRGVDITQLMKYIIEEDNTLEVAFKKKTSGTLRTLTNEGGSVTFQGQQDGAELALGTEVSLIVTPKEGYELTSLKVGGKDVKDSKKFKVSDNNTIEAVFNKKTYTLTTPTTTNGKLEFKDIKAGEKVEYGQNVAITATPEEGYELASLTVRGKDIKDAKNFIVGDDNTVAARFKKKTYTLTLPAETEQGSVEFEGYNNGDKAEYGTEVSVKILPKKGYELESITAGGKDITATKKFVVGENNDIIVKWTEKLYSLVAPKVEGGYIEFLGIEEGDRLKLGQKIRIKLVPNKGYTLDKLTVGGKDISADQILTVDENNDIVLSFRKATAIELLEDISFAVYPNPATEFVKVEGLPANAQVEVINLIGKRVLSAKADFSGSLELNISHLPKGLYLLRSGKAVVKLQVR